VRNRLKLKFFKLVDKVRNIFVRILLGKSAQNSLGEIENMKSQIEFMSGILSEQSRLIASVALIQSDLAKSISDSKSTTSESSDYLLLKIPIASDDFLN